MEETILIINVSDFTVDGANSAFLEEFGLKEEDVLGKRCCEITGHECISEKAEGYDCYLRKTIAAGKPAVAEHVHCSRDGGKIHMEISIYPLKNGKNQVSQVLHVSKDITAKKKAEEDLIKNHEELSRLFKLVEGIKKEWERTLDCTADMIILTDAENRIKRCNRAFKDFTGKSYEGILKKDCLSLLTENGIVVEDLPCRDTEVFCEMRGRWFVINSYPFKETESTISGSVTLIADSTDRKKITLELEAKNRELEDAYVQLKASQLKILQQEKMASIGQLAAGVAHEINSPVGFITSNLGTLRKYIERVTEFVSFQDRLIASLPENGNLRDELNKKREQLKLDYIIADTAELIRESLDGTERVKRIVQDLKSFSRVDEAENKMADINAGLESTINIAWNELKYKATLKKEYGDIPHTKCNPGQLNQVFMNILINAAQAIEKQGEITVKTWHENGEIYVSIADTGCGMPQDNVDRIFEPFFTTKEVGQGTGLGLSIAYDIVKKHGGAISVESEEGKGTTFTIAIPIIDGG